MSGLREDMFDRDTSSRLRSQAQAGPGAAVEKIGIAYAVMFLSTKKGIA